SMGFNFFLSGVIPVSKILVDQGLNSLMVAFEFLRLIVGTMRTTDFGAFIPIKTQPAKAVQNGLQRLLDIPLLIGVIDAQNELAAMLLGKEPIEEGRSDAANMQKTSRTRGKTCANHITFLSKMEFPSAKR